MTAPPALAVAHPFGALEKCPKGRLQSSIGIGAAGDPNGARVVEPAEMQTGEPALISSPAGMM